MQIDPQCIFFITKWGKAVQRDKKDANIHDEKLNSDTYKPTVTSKYKDM